jgi:hypothetical protein
VPASGHALTAVDASASLWAYTAKVRVGNRVSGLTEEDSKGRHLEAVAAAHAFGYLFEGSIRGAEKRIDLDSKHALGLVEVWV